MSIIIMVTVIMIIYHDISNHINIIGYIYRVSGSSHLPGVETVGM